MRNDPVSKRRHAGRSDVLLLLRAVALVLALLLAWIGWSMHRASTAGPGAADYAIEIAELRGRITYLDEYLTMSARMAALSGDKRWIERYETKAQDLDSAIRTLGTLAPPNSGRSLAGTLMQSQHDIAQMQRRAIDLAKMNKLGEAQAILNGAEIASLEDGYRGWHGGPRLSWRLAKGSDYGPPDASIR